MDILFIVIYSLIVIFVLEISAVLLILSGLDKDIARFQAISMLTSTGFTTKESELILRHPVRRNIAMFLILFGGFSLAVLISSISKMMQQNFRIPQMIAIVCGMAIVLLTVKNKKIKKLLRRKLHRHLEQEFKLHELPIGEVLYTSDKDWVTGIPIYAESAIVNQAADTVFLPEEDIALLLIRRGIEKIRQRCIEETVQEGDVLYVYGSKAAIEKKFGYELKKFNVEMQKENNVTRI